MYCRIRLQETNYQEYHNYRILGSSSFDKCLEIYREYVTYKKLGLGHVANKNEIALYKRLGYDYYYLGESSDYKSKLQGYEISNFFDEWQN